MMAAARVAVAAVAVWMAGANSAPAAPPADGTVRIALADDGRSYSVTAPGFAGFRAGFFATIETGGGTQVLASATGTPSGSPPRTGAEATPFGPVAVTTIALQFDRERIDLLLRFGPLPGGRGVFVQAGIRNGGADAVRLVALGPAVAALQPAGTTDEWLLTGLHPATPVIASPGQLDSPLEIHEYGGLYRRDGTGFLFGPAGASAAYVSARFASAPAGGLAMDLRADMGRVRVDPGETRWGQGIVLWMEPPQAALAGWADWVARTHGAPADPRALSGWSSWNFFGRAVTGADVREVIDAVARDPDRWRPDVIQIDEGYTPVKFPGGLGDYARQVAGIGVRPGLKLDLRMESGSTELVQIARRRGFTYLKLGCVGTPRPWPEKKTAFEALRDRIAAARTAAGPDTYLLYCAEQPNRAVVGHADASRIGRQATRAGVRGAIDDVLRSFPLGGRWYAADCDSYYLGTDIGDVSRIEGGWPLVRTWMSMVGLSCGAAITCDPWHWEEFGPYRRNLEVLTPPARERTEVSDLCTGREWPRLVGRVRRDWGDWTVALLWNPAAVEQAVELDFARAGMDPRRRYAVWSFWDDRYLGVAEGAWTTPRLGPSASQHLCFTDLGPASTRPVLIGSNLHIYCGAAEIRRVTSLRDAMEIELTDAGARDGDLFVYSRRTPVLRAATGCRVSGPAKGGENVWRIGVHDRRRGAPQRIELGILLPVTSQTWFWVLAAVAAVSLLYGARRYLVALRLEREHALAAERARIARDMHDEVGSKLARLSLLGEMASDDPSTRAVDRTRAHEIARGVREAAGELEHIIWTVNPRHDTIAGLAHRVCQHAEEYFAETSVRCRFGVPPDLPTRPMRPDARAAVFRAVKEALANVLKHAGAATVDVGLRIDGDGFEIRIADDGRGFDPGGAAPARGGNGLPGMRERMGRLGGECRIESAPGRGTTVTLRWPLDKDGAGGGE